MSRPSFAIKITKREDGSVDMETFGNPSPLEVVALAEFGAMLGKYEFAEQMRAQRPDTAEAEPDDEDDA